MHKRKGIQRRLYPPILEKGSENMPLNQFDNSYEALSIFINQQDEKEGHLDLKKYFKELYKKQRQQYIFWEKDRVSGTELFNYIYNEQKAFNIVLPAKQPEPLLICYYLPLKKLTGEWVEDFFSTAADLEKKHPVYNSTDHHFMLAFSYELGNPIEGEEADTVIKNLLRIVNENREISKNIYILRVDGFDRFDNQEKGLIQLMHILSRHDAYRVDNLADQYSTFLKMIAYSDFYVNQAVDCRKRIDSANQWFEQQYDPDQTRVRDAIVSAIAQPSEKLRKEIAAMDRRKELYPVRITNFTGNPIFGYKNTSGSANKLLNARREEQLKKRREEIAGETDLSEVSTLLKDKLFFHDYEALKAKADSGELTDSVAEGILNSKGLGKKDAVTENVQKLVEMICGRVVQEVTKICDHLDEKKEEKTYEMKTAQRELMEAGRYKNLEECFARIYADTQVKVISGIIAAQNTDTITLVNDTCSGNWTLKGYKVVGQNGHDQIVYRYSDIDPREIVMIKECDMFDLTGLNADELLHKVL